MTLPLCDVAGLESPVLQYAICKVAHNPSSLLLLLGMEGNMESQEAKTKMRKRTLLKIQLADVAEVTSWVSLRRYFSDEQDLSGLKHSVIPVSYHVSKSYFTNSNLYDTLVLTRLFLVLSGGF